jgi:hypothetical protein
VERKLHNALNSYASQFQVPSIITRSRGLARHMDNWASTGKSRARVRPCSFACLEGSVSHLSMQTTSRRIRSREQLPRTSCLQHAEKRKLTRVPNYLLKHDTSNFACTHTYRISRALCPRQGAHYTRKNRWMIEQQVLHTLITKLCMIECRGSRPMSAGVRYISRASSDQAARMHGWISSRAEQYANAAMFICHTLCKPWHVGRCSLLVWICMYNVENGVTRRDV